MVDKASTGTREVVLLNSANFSHILNDMVKQLTKTFTVVHNSVYKLTFQMVHQIGK